MRNNKSCGKHRGYTYHYRVQAPLCVQASLQDPHPLKKRYPRSQVLADPPASPRRHRGFFKIAQNLPQISFKFRQARRNEILNFIRALQSLLNFILLLR